MSTLDALREHEPAQPARRRILLVEDNDDAREALRMELTLDGHEVFTAADGESGVEMARAQRPDIALIDVGLPGIDGFEVAQRLRDMVDSPAMLIVALTGYADAEHRDRARTAGFDAHLVKPVDPGDLAAVIRQSSTGRILS